MAGENGPARPDIDKTAVTGGCAQLQFLCADGGAVPSVWRAGRDISLRTEPAREIVRFSSDASIGFRVRT